MARRYDLQPMHVTRRTADILCSRGVGVPTTMTAELVGDDTYYGPFFDWGEGELVMQTGSDGMRYAASRNFVARAAP